MKKTSTHVKSLIVLAMIIVAVSQVFAEERIGNLVFDSIRKLQERNVALLNDARQMREERTRATRDKEEAKRKYLHAKEGSFDQKEAHADYSYGVARIFKSTYDELQLVRQGAEDHLQTLASLTEAMQRGNLGVNEKATQKIIREADSFFETSDKLLLSIAKYKDLITDPATKQKLSSAHSTTLMLSEYMANSRKNNNAANNHLPMVKINQLTAQMEEVYNAVDILSDLMRDKSNRLKLTNEIAAIELATMKLSGGGNTVITSLSKEILGPLKRVMKDSDSDLENLERGVLGGSGENGQEDVDSSWTKGLKNR